LFLEALDLKILYGFGENNEFVDELSETAGKRVLSSIEKFLCRKLGLKVNKEKSGVVSTKRHVFLGFSF